MYGERCELLAGAHVRIMREREPVLIKEIKKIIRDEAGKPVGENTRYPGLYPLPFTFVAWVTNADT